MDMLIVSLLVAFLIWSVMVGIVAELKLIELKKKRAEKTWEGWSIHD